MTRFLLTIRQRSQILLTEAFTFIVYAFARKVIRPRVKS